jgi:hypothetical protein
MATFCLDPAIGHVVGVLDGDRNGHAASHETAFGRSFGGALTPQQRTWLTDRIRYLPSNTPPEAWMWSLGTDANFRTALAEETNTDAARIDDVFAGAAPADVHNLPYLLSQRIGIDEGRSLLALAAAAARTQQVALAPLTQFISDRLALI